MRLTFRAHRTLCMLIGGLWQSRGLIFRARRALCMLIGGH
jgi:hypothetical protein